MTRQSCSLFQPNSQGYRTDHENGQKLDWPQRLITRREPALRRHQKDFNVVAREAPATGTPATTKRRQDNDCARTPELPQCDVSGKFNPGMTSEHIAKEDEREKVL